MRITNSYSDEKEDRAVSTSDENSLKSGDESGIFVGNLVKKDMVTTDDAAAIGTKETKDVNRLRFAVLIVILLSSLLVGLLVFFIVRQEEKIKFNDAFDAETTKIFKSLTDGIKHLVGSLDSFSTLVVSHARTTNSTWPFVTLPQFPNHASKMLSNSVGNTLIMSAIVTPTNRLLWEQYSMNNSNFVSDALQIMATDKNYFGNTTNIVSQLSPVVINASLDMPVIPYDTTRNLNVVWQKYPLGNGGIPPFNYDAYSISPATEIHANSLKKVYVTQYYLNPNPNNTQEVELETFVANDFSNKIPQGENPLEPISDVVYPIINYLDSVSIAGDGGSEVVGDVVLIFYWRDLIKDSLPYSNDGLIVVFDNDCYNNPFSYRIDGPTPVHLGYGDLHENEFDDWVFVGTFADIEYRLNQTKYTGVPLNIEHCVPTIRMYPSTTMRNRFITWQPIIFSISSCLIFVFTSIVFIIYDAKVERRQKVVLTSAERTNAVVTSLFPSQVRDQILNDANNNNSNKYENSGGKERKGKKDNNNIDAIVGISSDVVSSPIADLYPESTILFADIKGFTFWSASRTPIEVFILLETLYNEYDKCARSRRVFKVETIGDCYVAVVGLPEPCKNHAVVMVRFADDMLAKTGIVLADLAPTLGDKTLDLALRIGLNSGPTTAGVLRGEKSRFQLFGDTVNTAARMESNSIANRIHCSQSTADQLIMLGKGQWLIKRDDLVVAKGKGAMQTYWVMKQSATSTNVSSSVDDSTTKDTEHVVTYSYSDGLASNLMIQDVIDELSVVSIPESVNSF